MLSCCCTVLITLSSSDVKCNYGYQEMLIFTSVVNDDQSFDNIHIRDKLKSQKGR